MICQRGHMSSRIVEEYVLGTKWSISLPGCIGNCAALGRCIEG